MTDQDTNQPVKLKRTLGMGSLLLYGIAMMFPMAPVAVFGEVSSASMGHMALCYFLAVIPMSFTAYSYGQMAGAFPIAGSAYSYASHAINPFVGFLSGWGIFLSYALFPILNYIIIGIFMNALFGLAPWISILASIFIISIVNLAGIRSLSIINNFLVCLMFLVVFYFIISAIISLGDGVGLGGFTTKPFYNPETFNFSAILFGTSIACFSFMGFDAMTTLSEEVKEPQKLLPKATVIVCFFMGGLFIVQAYFAQSVFPDFTAFVNNDEAFFQAAEAAGGGTLLTFVSIAMVAGAFANAIDSQASVARIMYSMGRDEMLPKKIFAYLHPKTQVPVFSILLLAVIAIVVVLIIQIELGLVIITINFGALVAFMLVNISVICYYYVREKQRSGMNFVRYLIMPTIGFITCFVLFLNLAATAKLIGGVWLAIGFVVMCIVTKGFKKKPVLEI